MPTPLINKIRVQGGTFITFSSSARDISKTFTDDDARFVFSKFVLLDLPDVKTPTNLENNIVWEALGAQYTGTFDIDELNINNNINISTSFQNYVLNLEQLILEGQNNLGRDYNLNLKTTVTERIFWKWLINTNAIRFRKANSAEVTNNLIQYTEEDNSSIYKQVVKYIGDIDLINNVSKAGHSYTEIYINVPTGHGDTPLKLFKTYIDQNYGPGMIWYGSDEYIKGRNELSEHPDGLSLKAFYDYTTNKSYKTNPITNTDYDLVQNNPFTVNFKNIKISQMDSIILNFDATVYKPIIDNPEISSISEFNASNDSNDFSFNTVLVYYDTYSESTPLNRATNLYGVLFLDDYVNQGDGTGVLKRFDKFKPNKITKLNGNAYGLKLNLKFDTSIDNVGVETIINDYNTFSMDLFVDAMNVVKETSDIFEKQIIEIIDIKQKIAQLESFYFSQDDLNIISRRISALETSLNNAKLTYTSTTGLLDLINKNSDNINLILSGQLSNELSYNTDILKSGDGITIDKSDLNSVRVINKTQQYTSFPTCLNVSTEDTSLNNRINTKKNNGKQPLNPLNGNTIKLGKFGNYYKQYNTNSNDFGIETFEDNVIINIDDSEIRWQTGQVFRFVFNDKINLNDFNIIFKTDKNNNKGDGVYGVIIQILPIDILSDRPIIDIICADNKIYKFNIDIIR